MAALLAVAGCHSAAVRAERQAALADQLMALKAYPAAATALGRATALDSDNPTLWLKLGRAQLQAGNTGAADQAFQRAAELVPDSVEALENLVVLAVRAGQIDRARRILDPLLVLQPDDPAGLLAQGAIALRERRAGEALAAADRLIAVSPDVGEAYVLRARALWAQGQRDEALALLRKRAALSPDGADGIEVRALLVDYYRQSGDLAGVRSTALELHRLQPKDPSYALESARALHAQGRDAEADGVLAALMQAHPGSTAIVQAVIDYRRATLPPAQAREAVAALAARARPPIVALIANALTDMGAPAQALALVGTHGGGIVEAGTVDAAIATARALAASGQAGPARARLDAVLAFDEGNVAALVARARLRMAAHDFAGALADAQLAQASDGTSQPAALLVAQVQAAAGDRVLAQQAFAQAVRTLPDSFPVLTTYLDWLEGTGRARDGITPAASFARQHRGNRAAWRRYAALCRETSNPCLAEAEVGLGAAG